MLQRMRIAGLTLDPDSNTPIVILKSIEDDRTLNIWIGLMEATSIAAALQNISFERPMTHDLFKNFLDLHHFQIAMVEVCDLQDNTFYSRIHFSQGEKRFSMDARPSDAIAMALRFQSPICVDDSVLEKVKSGTEGEAADKIDDGEKWAEYLKKLSADDFGKYKI